MPVSRNEGTGTQRRMEDNVLHTRTTDESADRSRTDSAESSARAVARLLANPRRTRRN
ncbi:MULTISPECIES: hypothetical protein [unclassified Blastococcus]